jgi:hypothetical protein
MKTVYGVSTDKSNGADNDRTKITASITAYSAMP